MVSFRPYQRLQGDVEAHWKGGRQISLGSTPIHAGYFGAPGTEAERTIEEEGLKA